MDSTYTDILSDSEWSLKEGSEIPKQKDDCHNSNFWSNEALATFRVFCAIWFTAEWILISASASGTEWVKQFVFITQESLFVTWIYFLALVIDDRSGKGCKEFLLVWNFMILVMECIVFVFFWAAILPGFIDTWDELEWWYKWGMISWHIVPFVTLTIDFFWNMHAYKMRHWWAPVLWITLYNC